MRSGQIIVAERERTQSSKERGDVRRKMHRQKNWATVLTIITAIILVILFVIGVRNFIEAIQFVESEPTVSYDVAAEIIDENGSGYLTNRMRQYIWQIDGDLKDLGYVMQKVIVPLGMMRELDIYIEGSAGYFKVNLDRGTAVSAEDIDKMIRYMGETPFEYVDVRVEGKAYWK